MQADGFNRIARIYDGLARLVFGNAIQQAQHCFLNDIPPKAKVLILGGGSGWLLSQLLEIRPQCKIWYIEASEKMLELSKAKVSQANEVHFVHGTEDAIPRSIQFDVIITNFYFDLFTERSLELVISKIKNQTKPHVIWLASDFINDQRWWQLFLLRMMYRFFRMVCGIEAVSLPDWNRILLGKHFQKKKYQTFFSGFIESAVYQHS